MKGTRIKLCAVILGYLYVVMALAAPTTDFSLAQDKTFCLKNDLAGCAVILKAGSTGADLTIFNNSQSITATNIKANIPASLTDVTQDSSSCNMLAPQNSCTLKLIPGVGAHPATAVSITGINFPTINITIQVIPASQFTIGGQIIGLGNHADLVLQNNGGDNLLISPNTSTFTFATPLNNGDVYNVSVLTSATGLTCSAAAPNNTGIINGSNVTDVVINCSNNLFTVGGNITNLGAANGLELQLNGATTLAIPANATNYTFTPGLAAGSNYSITILTQPTGPNCSIQNYQGTNIQSNVTNADITCSATTYTIGGILLNLPAGRQVVLQNNGADDLVFNGLQTNLAYNFPTQVPNLGSYNVTVKSQSNDIACTVANASGNVNGGNVSNVNVDCKLINSANIAYIASQGLNSSGSHVALCVRDINSGALSNCTSALNGPATQPCQGVTITTISGGAKVAYLSYPNSVVTCPVDPVSNKLINPCTTINVTNPSKVAFSTDPKFSNHVYFATINTKTYYTCQRDPSTGALSGCLANNFISNNFTDVTTISIQQLNSISNLYVAANVLNMCSQIAANGTLIESNCSPTAMGFRPDGLTYATINGNNYGYIVNPGLRRVRQCTLQVNGTLLSCNIIHQFDERPYDIVNIGSTPTQFYVAVPLLNQVYLCPANSVGNNCNNNSALPPGYTIISPTRVTLLP